MCTWIWVCTVNTKESLNRFCCFVVTILGRKEEKKKFHSWATLNVFVCNMSHVSVETLSLDFAHICVYLCVFVLLIIFDTSLVSSLISARYITKNKVDKWVVKSVGFVAVFRKLEIVTIIVLMFQWYAHL